MRGPLERRLTYRRHRRGCVRPKAGKPSRMIGFSQSLVSPELTFCPIFLSYVCVCCRGCLCCLVTELLSLHARSQGRNGRMDGRMVASGSVFASSCFVVPCLMPSIAMHVMYSTTYLYIHTYDHGLPQMCFSSTERSLMHTTTSGQELYFPEWTLA